MGARKSDYFIAPVGIDAYRTNITYPGKEYPVTLKEFKETLKSHAMQWGEQAVGKWFLEHEETPKMPDSPLVALAWGTWESSTYVAAVSLPLEEGTFFWDAIEFLKVDTIPDDWNAT